MNCFMRSGNRTVYVIKNSVTGKIYVGSTERKPSIRLQEHLKTMRIRTSKNEEMQRDYDLYGADSFSIREFGVFETKVAYRIEYALMDFLGSRNRDRGYNYKDVKPYRKVTA